MDYSNELLKGVKWVFFDLDDTLWDFSANSDITLKDLYNNFSVLRECYPDYSEYDEQFVAVAILLLIVLVLEVCIMEKKNPLLSKFKLFR